MKNKSSTSKDGEPEFAEFWKEFHLFPWNWANRLFSRSRYVVASALVMYALLAILTFCQGMAKEVSEEVRFAGPLESRIYALFESLENRVYVLLDYPSLTFIILGWILGIMLCIRWLHKIPSIFQWLWEGKRFESRAGGLKGEFMQFLQDYQKELLVKKKALPIGIVLLVMTILIGYWLPQTLSRYFFPTALVLVYVVFIIAFSWIFLVGILARVLLVTSRYIEKLTQQFEIKIQPNHPDGCGGLKPLGDFHLDAAIPMIYGGIILVIVSTFQGDDFDTLMRTFATIFTYIFTAPLAAITVFLPIWKIHVEMLEQKVAYQDAFNAWATELEQAILKNTRLSGKLEEAKADKEKLEILQMLHPDKLSYPVWPFKFTQTVLAILSSPILKVLVDSVTGIYSTFFTK